MSLKRAKRWSFIDQRYDTVLIEPDCSVYEHERLTPVRCPSCNKVYLFEEMQPSLRYQDAAGFGYAVCEHCYRQEQELKKLLVPKVEEE